MADSTAGKLQIYEVEESTTTTVTCIVRCVAGVVRTGQHFSIDSDTGSNMVGSPLILDWINRYERLVDFIDPPHSAKVHMSGEVVGTLERGMTLTAITVGK
ncbi:hypothetical protein RFN57_39365 [Streptomyces violaceochromogenes]|uniref:Uncharacterized protein n=1 Tax=Streptomyces violaceochromogenes TaxID=67377 RepID=A0ABU6M9W4_9ACTN|nr:hypothetical protein [Streptomyces violaceochromogenes]MEC7058306.1 hypothetical protein [Streptomyces violaceochromogenes]GHC48485.1 hypothetical protein GCM10010309_03910 [Streptomyces violaceochromogenes]